MANNGSPHSHQRLATIVVAENLHPRRTRMLGLASGQRRAVLCNPLVSTAEAFQVCLRTVDCIPPMHVGKRSIFFACRVLAYVVRDCREFNERELLRLKPGRAVKLWAVPVSVVCGFDETARVVEGGGL